MTNVWIFKMATALLSMIGTCHAFVPFQNRGTRLAVNMILDQQHNPYMNVDGEGHDGNGKHWQSSFDKNPFRFSQQQQEQQQRSHHSSSTGREVSAYMQVHDDDNNDHHARFKNSMDVDSVVIYDDDEEEEEEEGASPFQKNLPDWVTAGASPGLASAFREPHGDDMMSSSSSSSFSSSFSSQSSSSAYGVPGPPPYGMFLREKEQEERGFVDDLFRDWTPPSPSEEEEESRVRQALFASSSTPDENNNNENNIGLSPTFQQDETAWAETYQEIDLEESSTSTPTTSPSLNHPLTAEPSSGFGIWENQLNNNNVAPRQEATMTGAQAVVDEATTTHEEQPLVGLSSMPPPFGVLSMGSETSFLRH